MAELTDEDLRAHVAALIPEVDLESTGLKQFVKKLSKKLDMDLKSRKDFIKKALTEEIERQRDQSDDEEEEADDDDDESEEEESEEEDVPKAKAKKRGGGGLAQKKEISDKLAAFLGQGKVMARTEIVKALWAYIHEHELQNPANKREIFLDQKMKNVFGCDSFTMFTMNKYIGEHIHPFNKIDWSTPSKPKKRKAPRSSSTDKKKRKAGNQPPYRLSDQLAEVVGATILPRPQVVSHIWKYIKANDLQNPDDKREILCDDKLRAIMKKDKVSMFKMNQLITPHLLEKVDRSLYQGGDNNDSEEE